MRAIVTACAAILTLTCIDLSAQCRPNPGRGSGGNRGSSGGSGYSGPGDTIRGGGLGRPVPTPSDGPRATPTGDRRPPRTGAPRPTGARPTPGTGGARNPSTGPRPGPRTPRGIELGPDRSGWQHWWALHRDQFLQLKTHIHVGGAPTTGSDDFVVGRGLRKARRSLAPTAADRRRVARRLLAELQRRDASSELRAAALVALAHCAKGSELRPHAEERMIIGSLSEAERAALALGIAGTASAMPRLVEVARRAQAPRLRAFACYALGNIGRSNARRQRDVFDALRDVVAREANREVRAAALHGIRLLAPKGQSYASTKLRHRVVAYCDALWKDGEQDQVVRAHALTSACDLGGEACGDGRRRDVLALIDQRDTPHELRCSAILSAGRFGPADTKLAIEASTRLRKALSKAKHRSCRHLAAIALGRIGGNKNRTILLRKLLRSSTPDQDRPWLALGLALLVRDGLGGDRTVNEAVRKSFRRARNAEVAAGLAIALGLLRDRKAGKMIQARLRELKGRDEEAGHLAIALGLLDHRGAVRDLQRRLKDAERRPELYRELATALAMLGDNELSLRLATILAKPKGTSVQDNMIGALARVGDRRTLDTLLGGLDNDKMPSARRTAIVTALGKVCDPRPVPWTTPIAIGLNWRAPLDSLNNGHDALLDTR